MNAVDVENWKFEQTRGLISQSRIAQETFSYAISSKLIDALATQL